jgi:hypothetical protein
MYNRIVGGGGSCVGHMRFNDTYNPFSDLIAPVAERL